MIAFMADFSGILKAIENGDQKAASELLPLVYDRLRDLAEAKNGPGKSGPFITGDGLVHEAYLRLVDVKECQAWNSQGHFFAAAAEAMRRILIENARRRHTQRRGGGRRKVRLCEIWTELLGVDRVGIEDDFLDLGGDSFSAVRLLGQIQTEFGKRFELPDLFSDPRVVSLAALLDGKRQPTNLKWLIPTRFFDDSPPTHAFPGTFIFAYVTTRMMEGMKLKFPVYSISIDWKYSTMDYSEGVTELAAHHLEELKRIDPEGPYRLAGYSFGGLVAYEMARQLTAAGDTVEFTLLLDPTPPYGTKGASAADFRAGERNLAAAAQGRAPTTAVQKLKRVPTRNKLAWVWARRGALTRYLDRAFAKSLQFLVVRGLWPAARFLADCARTGRLSISLLYGGAISRAPTTATCRF